MKKFDVITKESMLESPGKVYPPIIRKYQKYKEFTEVRLWVVYHITILIVFPKI